MNIFLNLPESARNDFYLAKYHYYRSFNLVVLTIALFLYLGAIINDFCITASISSFVFIMRLLFILPLLAVYFTSTQSSNYKLISGLSLITIHAFIIGALLINSSKSSYSSINIVLIFAAFILFLITFSAPLSFSIVTYLALIGDFYFFNYYQLLENSPAALVSLIIPIIFLSALTFTFTQFYFQHYLMEKKLAFALLHDPLTKVFNRRKIDELMGASHDISFLSSQIAILMMDIDHLKAVNDHFGHDNGDRILQFVADCIRNSLRASDLVIRWGGEEFAAILFDCPEDQVDLVAERIRNAVERSVNGVCPITISIGTALYPGGDCLDTIKNAGIALKDAKNSGRNKVVRYSDPKLFIPAQV
ncbi:GGDEF domain-containing protein [Eubacteriaceae bacterium ES2]|nr:GGDEF domain-containing protein [Eubacteriaceae bacterium ES2]